MKRCRRLGRFLRGVTLRKNDSLKVIGLLIMIIDHFNLFVFNANPVIYTIARFLGFPLFAYGVSIGSLNTSNFQKYITRLLIVGLIVQPFYYLATDHNNLNVIFTLALGALAVRFWHTKIKVYQVISIMICLSAGTWANTITDYGAYGVSMILAFSLGPIIASIYLVITSILFYMNDYIQFMAVLTIPIIYYFPMPKISLPRWVYYVGYPGHLFIISAIKMI